jgi:hypothetical protein
MIERFAATPDQALKVWQSMTAPSAELPRNCAKPGFQYLT